MYSSPYFVPFSCQMVVMKGLTYHMIGIAINYIIRSFFTQEVYKSGLAKSCIDWRSTQIIMGTKQKLYANYEDWDHFAFIPFYYVACLHECWQFLESFLVAQYNPLVRFAFACRSD